MKTALLIFLLVFCVGWLSPAHISYYGSKEITVMDSYSESNQNDQYPIYSGGQIARGQSFTGNGDSIVKATFYLRKVGSPTGSGYAKVWAHTGTFGTNGTPTGSALATSSALDVSTIAGSFALYNLSFPSPYETTDSTYYVITFTYNGGDASNNIELGHDDSSPTHGGNRCYSTDESSWGFNNLADSVFYVYGQ